MRKICVVTGTRAEYGLLKPVMQRIQEDSNLVLQVVATGSHLLPDYGLTIERIIEDGFKIDARVPIVLSGDSKDILPHSIGHGIIGFSQAFEILDPDFVLVLGDRYEIFAAAVAASYGGRVLVHIHGGDKLRGGFDEYSRHAITKLSQIHFAATEKSAGRIIKLGENPENVFISGSPAIETIYAADFQDKMGLCHKLGLDPDSQLALFVLHPVSTSPESAADEVKIVLESTIEFDPKTVILYPNVDPGSKRIIEVLEYYKNKNPDKIKLIKSLSHIDYLNLMKVADFMIGNSSSGIIESPTFKIPVINIGHRQEGRECAGNVIHVDYSREEITNAINTCLFDPEFRANVSRCINPYGEGRASEIICNTLRDFKITPALFSKSINYD